MQRLFSHSVIHEKFMGVHIFGEESPWLNAKITYLSWEEIMKFQKNSDKFSGVSLAYKPYREISTRSLFKTEVVFSRAQYGHKNVRMSVYEVGERQLHKLEN